MLLIIINNNYVILMVYEMHLATEILFKSISSEQGSEKYALANTDTTSSRQKSNCTNFLSAVTLV